MKELNVNGISILYAFSGEDVRCFNGDIVISFDEDDERYNVLMNTIKLFAETHN